MELTDEPPFDKDDPRYVDWVLDRVRTSHPYLDRECNPISLRQWGELHQREEYVRIAGDYLDEGNIWISTVWLGMDHSWGMGPPLIFETMVFVHMTPEQIEEKRQSWFKLKDRLKLKAESPAVDRFPWDDLECQRYSTEQEAREGHRTMVDSLRMSVELLENADSEGI